MSAISANQPAEGMTMDSMPTAPAHAKPKDHLWVLVIIAACALIETFPSWVGIGAVSGFPRFGRMPTDWTLAVTSEAYWGYALYAGIVAVAGPRSRAFALWSAAAVFVLSLMGQAAYHLMAAAHRAAPPQWVVVFVAALPVIVLALIAVLVHLRRLDREEAVEAGERSTVQAEMDALRAGHDAAVAELAAVRGELTEAVAKTETLTRKLDAATARKRRPATGRKPATATARKQEPATATATAPEADSDVDREALVLKYLAEGHSASEAGKLAGLSDSRGRQIARKLAAAAPKGQDPEE